MLSRNPFYWLASRERLSTLPLWAFILGVAGTLAGIWLCYADSRRDLATGLCVAGGFTLTFSLFTTFASMACQRLAEDRHSGTLELLLSTPLSVRTILRGQWLALGRQFAGPLAAVVLIDSILYGMVKPELGSTESPAVGIVIGSICLLLAVAALIALGWTGMWMALRAKQASHASVAAFWRIMLLPWLLIILVLHAFYWARSTPYIETHFPHLVSFTIVSVLALNSLFWSLWSRAKLHTQFRRAATDRFQPPRPSLPWWKPLFTWVSSARAKLSPRAHSFPDVTTT